MGSVLGYVFNTKNGHSACILPTLRMLGREDTDRGNGTCIETSEYEEHMVNPQRQEVHGEFKKQRVTVSLKDVT